MCIFLSSDFADNVRSLGWSGISDRPLLRRIGEFIELEKLAWTLDSVGDSDGIDGVSTEDELKRTYLILTQVPEVQKGTYAAQLASALAGMLRQSEIAISGKPIDLSRVQNSDYVGAEAASRGVLYYNRAMIPLVDSLPI